MHSYKIIEKGCLLTQASKALILLHGRGGTAEGIIDLSKEFCDDSFYVVAPQATNSSWYPYSFLEEEKRNEPWLASAVDVVKTLVDHIANNIPKEHIFIMGFSQGACLSLEFSSRYAEKYGGVVAFTGGLIGKTIDKEKYHGRFEGTKVFIANGDHDPHVPLERSEESKQVMEALGAKVTLKVYPGMPHTIIKDEIDWVKTHIF
jgi:phospholipase/carboxylesterase